MYEMYWVRNPHGAVVTTGPLCKLLGIIIFDNVIMIFQCDYGSNPYSEIASKIIISIIAVSHKNGEDFCTIRGIGLNYNGVGGGFHP
jgi:hypothetical protein